jgi:transcriptional regulator with GAF, ATPase, and Fis domain
MIDQQNEDISDLQQAKDLIDQQTKEISSLRTQLEREHFATDLRDILKEVSTMNTILSPVTHSQILEIVVQTAAQVISARSGSLFLIDEEAQELIFEVAIGPEAQSVKKHRVPLGHGIVGLVAVSGQPMSIADAQQDGRLAYDIASSVNFIPTSVLCVPLYYNDHVIGALELLDKQGASSFSLIDMQLLGTFARQAAITIAQSRSYHDLQVVFNALLTEALANANQQQRERLQQNALTFSMWAATEDPASIRARKLALLLYEINTYGENEGDMCLNIVNNLVSNIRLQQSLLNPELIGGRQGSNI